MGRQERQGPHPPVTGTPSLTTSWGTLSYFSGSGSNVLTFKGTIPDTASGVLKVTGKSGTIKDLSGKALAGSMPDQTLASLDTSHVYAITYDLAGGALPEGASNPATYTYETPSFSLAPPVRPCYVFAGWTEGSGSTPNPSVAIYRSHGDRAYVANWTPITYFVHFDAGAADATGPMPDQTLTYDAPQALSSNAFTRADYTFAGWRGADGTIYPDGATVLNLTNAQDAVVSFAATWRINIPYIDANGTEQVCTEYTVITNTAEARVEYGESSAERWYVVTNAVAIDGKITFLDRYAHLIVCDGATLAATNSTPMDEAVHANGNLTIYGQAGGTGAVSANGSRYGIYAYNGITINGGSVTATAQNYGISAQSVTVNGGTIDANGGTYGVNVWFAITLGWTNPTDSITASSYNRNARIDKTLTDGTAIYKGNSVSLSALRGVTLVPAYSIELPEGVVASGVVTQIVNTAYALPDANVTLSAAPGVSIRDVTVNGVPLADGTCSFTASADGIAVTATVGIPYIDEGGVERLCTDYTVLTNATGYVEYGANGEENWYVVTNAVTISGQLSFNDGRIHLILCDGATLTVTNGNGDAIYPSNNIDSSRELVLYGQANGTGGLVANGSGYGIRIHSGSVTINGGNVTATGGHPGIYAADTVTINGGSVTATGGEGNAGIYANSLVIINGGSVTATGGYGIRVNNSSITINGGNVTATATSGNSDGIYAGGTFTINGGSVTATATGGKNGIYAGGDITINGGTVTATGGSDTANHNGIYANKSLTINGGNVTATGGYCGIRATINKITLGWTNPADSITASGYYGSSVHVKDWQRFTDGDNVYKNNITGAALADIAGKTLVPAYSITLPEGVVASGVVTQIVNTAYARPGDTVTLSAAPGYAIGDITVNGVPLADGTCSFTASADGITVTATVGIPYIDADGTERICTDYTVLTNATGDVTYGTNGATAWYVVTTNVTISGQLYFGDTTAHLILCDGATLAVTNANGTAIQADGLTIYCQTNGTGTVTATGGGIGGNGIYAHVSVTIKGGTVTAEGGNGIYAGGSVTIKGGTVTAEGDDCGIYAANGSVTIKGGTVTAAGSISGIETGVGSVTINGGTVTANGDEYGYGISAGSKITLGWTNPTDSITASSYNRPVRIDKVLTDGTAIYKGNSVSLSALRGVTLRPAYRITLPAGVVASGVVTQIVNTAYALPDATVTLSAAPGYAIGDITVNGVPLADGTCSFTASDASITVTATVGIPYIDEGGVERICTDFTVITNATGDVEYDGGSGWYVVTDAVTISGKLSFADSTAHLILCDGATLAVTNSTPYDEAVRADGDLAIYGQTHGTGVLAANANGSDFGYAIYACYDLTINGGTVTANGHLAIYALDDLTVNGGTVTGNGGNYGIYALDDLTVNGGTVTGNGGRYGISVDVLTVNGGTVTGNAPDGVGIGIVALYAQWTAHNTYTVRFDPDGGTGTMPDQTFTYGVTTNLAANAFTRTGYPFLGWRGADGSIYPDGATVSNLIVRHAYHKEDIWKLYDRMPYPGKSNDDYSPGDGALQNTDGDNGVNLYTGFENVAWNPEDPATAALISQNAGWFDEHDARNGVSMKLVEDFPNFYRKPVGENQNAVVTLTAIWQPPVPYIDADGVEQQCLEYTVLTNAAGNVEYGTVNEESWYAVTNDVTISGQLYFNGKPRLIVCDGATLTVTNDSGEAIFSDFGIALYGQTNGTGIVTAKGRHSEGGIYALDDLTINGVTVTATGGDSGIRTLGDVTINGGRVTATGDDYGIYAYQGSVTINGGNVAAVSTSGSVGIWAGGGMIHLGWRSPTDSIYASSYHASYATAFNQKFTDGTTIYQGWYTGNSQEGLEGKTFRPYNATPSYPAYLGLPDDPADDTTEESGIRAKYDAWAARYGYDASGVNEAAFLLNVAPWATPIELRIVGIEVVEDGAQVRVAATAGGAAADLGAINGVMSLLAGDDLGALAPKAASGITYSEGEATIFVPASAGRFVKAVIGVAAPEEE